MGVTPALIGGAWVGGEYRSIHFRTGALGQGSRTALPIFGYFIQSVLNDPKFKHYRQKFSKPKEDIPAECYTCARYYRAEPDSFELDSLDFSYVGGSDTATHRAVRSADGSVHERMDEIIETIE